LTCPPTNDLPAHTQGPNRSELSRDFTYVDDVVCGVVGAVDTSPASMKGEAQYR
jgi:hypothetical protein